MVRITGETEKQKKKLALDETQLLPSSSPLHIMAPAPRPGRSLADQLADLEDPTPEGMLELTLNQLQTP